MLRIVRTILIVAAVASMTPPAARAQFPFAMPYGGGFGAYGGNFGPNIGGFGSYGGWAGGFSSYGSQWGNNAYGPFNFGQQLYQQQASQTQQIFQQQQQSLLDQIHGAENQFARLDGAKQQLFVQYLGMNESDKAVVRTGLMNTYLNLDAHGREAWQRDAVAQIIIGHDMSRLDGLGEYQSMSDADKAQLRAALVQKYRLLPPTEQQAWRNDPIVLTVLGSDWWLR